MKRQNTGFFFIVGWLILCSWHAAPASAAVTLDVRLVRGGIDLDFETVQPGQNTPTREVELTVTSSGSGQYRIYQEFPNFLVNEHGNRLPDDALLMQISRGTSGSLATGAIIPVTAHAQELFVSNSSGTSDNLLLAYSVRQDASLAAGFYRGILRFRVESLDAGILATQTLTVHLGVSTVQGIEQSPSSPSRLDFKSVAPGQKSEELIQELTVRNNASGLAELLQDLPEPLVSGQGDRLPSSAFSYALTSAESTSPWQVLAELPERLLAGFGGGLQLLRLTYAVDVPPAQRAGLYRGVIRLRLNAAGMPGVQELRIPVVLEVPEVFMVSVKPSDGASRLDFGRAPASEGAVERSMAIEVTTNIGRPYQVLAGLDHALVLPTGETLPPQALTWAIRQAGQGTALITADSQVPVAAVPIYQSDSVGSPETFSLVYRLSVPEDARDGLYSGRMDVSVTLF